MFKLQLVGMERDAAIGIAACSTVFQVTLDGASYLAQLATYLMMSARVEFYLQQPVTVRGGYDLIVKNGLLAARHLTLVCTGLVSLLIAGQPVGQRTLHLRRTCRHNGPICLADSTRTEHLTQTAQRLAGTGKEYKSADGSVQPMYYTQEDVARLMVTLGDVLFYRFREWGVSSLVALDYFPTSLGNDNHMVIFVDDFQTDYADYMFIPPST